MRSIRQTQKIRGPTPIRILSLTIPLSCCRAICEMDLIVTSTTCIKASMEHTRLATHLLVSVTAEQGGHLGCHVFACSRCLSSIKLNQEDQFGLNTDLHIVLPGASSIVFSSFLSAIQQQHYATSMHQMIIVTVICYPTHLQIPKKLKEKEPKQRQKPPRLSLFSCF